MVIKWMHKKGRECKNKIGHKGTLIYRDLVGKQTKKHPNHIMLDLYNFYSIKPTLPKLCMEASTNVALPN